MHLRIVSPQENLSGLKEKATVKNRRPISEQFTTLLLLATIAVSLLALAGSARAQEGAGPAPVNLKTAGQYAILTKTGITDVPTSAVTGNVGTSPITGAADLLTCVEVTG